MPGLILEKQEKKKRDTNILKVACDEVIFWSQRVFVYEGDLGTLTRRGKGEGEKEEEAKTTAK